MRKTILRQNDNHIWQSKRNVMDSMSLENVKIKTLFSKSFGCYQYLLCLVLSGSRLQVEHCWVFNSYNYRSMSLTYSPLDYSKVPMLWLLSWLITKRKMAF